MSIFSNILPGVNTIKIWVYVITITLILSVVVLGYQHYNNIVNQLAVSQANEKTLQLAVDTQKDTIDKALSTIDDWKAAQKRYADTVEEMIKINQAASSSLRRLNETLAQHDLTKLSLAKPNLVADIINRATDDSFRLLRCESGAKDPDCAVRLSKARENRTVTQPTSH